MPSRPLKNEEVHSVLTTITDLKHKALIILGCKTGFRISELLSLTIQDVVTKEGVICDVLLVKRSNMKGKQSSRSVVLHDQAKRVLHELLLKNHADSSRTSCSKKVFPISRFSAHRIVKNAAHRAGLVGRISTHSMRKCFAMNVYDKTGKDVVATQRALGHKSLASTTKYLSVGQDIIDRAILED